MDPQADIAKGMIDFVLGCEAVTLVVRIKARKRIY
jgi:hypothetical protein